MLSVIGGLFSLISIVLGQIVGYHMVIKYLPEWHVWWTIGVIFTWIGLVFVSLGKASKD